MMRRGVFAVLSAVLATITFAGLNIASWNWLAPARIDFTQNRLFTLSDSARIVVGRVVEPIELELVYSRAAGAQFPAIRAHAERVREMMKAIAAEGGDRVVVRETDPPPYSEDEDRAMAAGLQPAPTGGGDPIYFGVIGRNAVDDEIAIPFLAPERDALLEYDLVRLIAQLDDPAPPRVAVLSSLPAWQGDGSGPQDAFILRELRRAFEIVPVDASFETLPANADVLLMVHPAPLSEAQAWAVDQFILRKGRALIAVDPAARVALAQAGVRAVPSSALGALERTLGAGVGPRVAADRALALPVETDAGGGRRVVEGQPLFIAAPRALMSGEDPVTSDLTRAVNFGDAGAINAHPEGATHIAPLVTTTEMAALVDASFAMNEPAPRDVLAVYEPAGEQVLAARITGELRSAFEAPPSGVVHGAGHGGETAHLQRSQSDVQVVLIADSDAFDDGFYINPANATPMADNAAFILNAMDNLAGDAALMELRSRAPAARPMERVDELRASARERLYAQQTELERRLGETQQRLDELQAVRPEGSAARTARETAEIERFTEEASEIRRSLRGVEREFRADIDALAARLEFFNVWLPPMLIGGLGFAVFAMRSRRRGGRR